MVGFLLLRGLVGESWSVIALFNSFAHLLFIPALLLMPLALLLRRRLLIAILLPVLLLFVLDYGVTFTSRPAHAADNELRLLTYNLKAQTHNLDPALSVIRDIDADVVALQEVSTEMAARIKSDLIEMYPYQALHPQTGNPIPGQAVLSRWPLLADTYWRVYLAAQRVTLDIDGQPVTVYNAHPMQPMQPDGFSMRGQDIDDILERADAETVPLLLVGDFNMSDQSDDYRRVAADYHDSYRAAGWGLGFTFPADLPFLGAGAAQPPGLVRHFPALVRLDYVFHDAYFETLTAEVWPERGGSDHLPVVATLALVEADR